MSRRAKRSRSTPRTPGRSRSIAGPAPVHRPWPLIGLAIAGLVGAVVLAALVLRPGTPSSGGAVAWSRLGTTDVHSLVFPDDDPDHPLFGHHRGILESRDGGRTWRSLGPDGDAMQMQAAGDDSIIIAGHEVFAASDDGGATWSQLGGDLPGRDVHGFALDPDDASRMWAYLATGGLYGSRDGGLHWTRVFDGDRPFLAAVRGTAGAALLAIDPFTGLVRSDDGGTTWTALSKPPDSPLTTIAATPDGRTVLVGTPNGMHRSSDGGMSWTPTGLNGGAFAVAVTEDGRTMAAVDRETRFYRSDDAGATWPGPA